MELNVLVYISPPLVIETKIKNKKGKEIVKYSGVLYEIWEIIREKLLEDKIIKSYKESFFSVKKNNTTMKDAYKYIVEGKYDIGIAYFSVVQSRNKSHFTRPLYLNKFAVAYFPEEANSEILMKAFYKGFLIPLCIGITVSLIIIVVLFLISKKWDFKENLEIFYAIIFRSSGKFAKKKNSFFSLFIFVLSLLFWVFMIGEMTTELRTAKKKMFDNKVDIESIISKKILCPEGYANNVQWTKYGAQIEENNTGDIVQKYKKNMDKYFGFFDDLEVLKLFKVKHPKLKISTENFGFDEIAWVIRRGKKMDNLLFHINNEIVYLQDNNVLTNICKSYFHKDTYLCQL